MKRALSAGVITVIAVLAVWSFTILAKWLETTYGTNAVVFSIAIIFGFIVTVAFYIADKLIK